MSFTVSRMHKTIESTFGLTVTGRQSFVHLLYYAYARNVGVLERLQKAEGPKFLNDLSKI